MSHRTIGARIEEKLDRILNNQEFLKRAAVITLREQVIMTNQEAARLNDITNTLGTIVQTLRSKLTDQADQATVDAVFSHLESIGRDPAVPIPAIEPALAQLARAVAARP